MLIGSDRFAALRSRAGRAGHSRCLAALLAGACVPVIALAGCGGSSHTTSTAAADASGAIAGGASTATTSTSTAKGTEAGTSSTGASASSSSSTTTTTASGQGNGSAGGGSTAPSGTAKNGPNDPAPSHGGSSGKPVAKSKPEPKTAGKTATGGVGAAGSGTGSAPAAGSGPSSSGSSAPNANTGIPYEVDSTSMEPTFQPETKIYYDPTRTHPQIGEVVVFYLPAGAEEGSCGEVMAGGRACTSPLPGTTKNKEISFKRVVGLPGDSIAIRAGHVIRNGQPEPEPPTLPCEKDERLNCEFPTPITVPPGHYYLMSDNRGLYKEDSRIFGAVPQEYILGTVEGG